MLGHRGLSWGHFAATVGCIGAILGECLGILRHVGAILGHFRPSWRHLGSSWPSWGHLGVVFDDVPRVLGGPGRFVGDVPRVLGRPMGGVSSYGQRLVLATVSGAQAVGGQADSRQATSRQQTGNL
jgi:hypothetical protein